jgi:hypothetical protein
MQSALINKMRSAILSTLTKDVVGSSEISVDIYQTRRRHIIGLGFLRSYYPNCRKLHKRND